MSSKWGLSILPSRDFILTCNLFSPPIARDRLGEFSACHKIRNFQGHFYGSCDRAHLKSEFCN
ncbi:hypothetical protein [Oxynema aestuarii]|uniref:hypothetical protein n=1 Tax=Oxynema aestuarii TaxID=2874213 RepID=UPI001B314BD0|nr:hypothetical protein [Oxynema aestuarii]